MAARRAGFTMVEAVVVIIMIGLLALFAMPAIGRTVAATRVQRASAVMATDIRTAFAMSAQQRRPLRITIDGGARVFRIQNREATTTLLETRYDQSSELALTQLSADTAALLIFPSGMASRAWSVSMQTTSENRRQVTMTRTGQVRILQP